MMPLFDMLNSAQNGQAMEAMARQFGLSPDQVRQATEALLPAFSQGLKRNVADPAGMGSFLNAMATGNHARYFEDAANAFGPAGMQEGNGILGHLFGSKDLSRAVAANAAQATGISQSILQQMLPVLASMIMGGLFKQSSAPSSGSMPGGNILGQILGQMMGQGGGANAGAGANPASANPLGFDPFNNPLGKVFKDMMGGGQSAAPQDPSSGQAQSGGNPFGDTPWGKMLGGFLGGGAQQAQPQAQAASPDPDQTNPSGRPRNPYDDIFGNMFETGRQQRDEYQKSTEAIFDNFLKGMNKPGA